MFRWYWLICAALAFSSCVAPRPPSVTAPGTNVCTVVAVGTSMDDARRNARQAILEDCLGAYVESQSVSRNSQSVKNVIASAAEGYVTDFKVVSMRRVGVNAEGYEIVASGKASLEARNDALRARISDLGNPTIMVLVQEKIDGVLVADNQSATERSMVQVFQDFEFVDKQQLALILARESGLPLRAYESGAALDRALLAAAELDANYLIVGKTDVVAGRQVEGTSMRSMQSTVSYKILDVNTAHVLAADSTTAAQPHVNTQQGAQLAIKKAVEAGFPAVKQQIVARWRAGNVIRLTLEGPTYDQILDSRFLERVRDIRGVNAVNDRGQSGNTVVVEVTAMMSGTKLYAKMRELLNPAGFLLQQREVKNGRIRVGLTLPPKKDK